MHAKLITAAAVSGLMLSAAFAQAPTTTPDTNPSAPAASPSTPPSSPSTSAATTGATSGSAQFVTAQTSDQWLASKFMGTDVVGTDDAKIGDVEDVLFDKNGQVLALVVGVGGFLGIGEKDVALNMKSFQVMPGTDGGADKLKLSMTKDQLKQAQAFEPYKSPRTTTGTGGSPAGSPAPRPSTPAR
jgi:sporulation protein YlmC with PRC-barrel domain